MADGGCNNSAPNDVVELEAMRRDTLSWHPCQIALCYTGSGLVVQYGDSNFEETITDEQDILKRLRVRSIPLQGDDCSFIKRGDHVLATKSSRAKGVLYDARIEEALHVRHSKRIHCRCSFRISFLHQFNEEEALTVPSSSIMKLSTKSIHLHPTISTFFAMMDSPSCLDDTQGPMIVDGMNLEMDINLLLEKQINEISNSTDISGKKFSMDFVFGQVDFKGQSNAPIIEASFKDPNGSNGSENKQHTGTTLEIPPVCIPSIEEEIKGSRFLSPLAARAALASSRSEFPQSPLKISEDKGLVKELFPTSNAPEIVEVSKEIDKRKKTGENKISQPSNSRFTRAKAQKVNGWNEAQRVTRSTVERAEKIEVNEYNSAADDNVVVQNGTFFQNEEKQNYPKRLTRSAAREGAEMVNEQLNYPKRLTRSFSQVESEKINVQPKRRLRKSSSPEVDLFKDVIVDTNTLEPENSLATEVNEYLTEERETNRKTCARKSTPKNSENGVGSCESTGKKCSSSKKQDTRFSPRLRTLRSQSKA